MIPPLTNTTEEWDVISLHAHCMEQHDSLYERQLALIAASGARDFDLVTDIKKTLLQVVKKERKEKGSVETTTLIERIDAAIAQLRKDRVEKYSNLISGRGTVFIDVENYSISQELRAELLVEFDVSFDREATKIRDRVVEAARKSFAEARSSLKCSPRQFNRDYEKIVKVKELVCKERQLVMEKYASELELLVQLKENLFKKDPTNIFLAVQCGNIQYVKKEIDSRSSWLQKLWSSLKSFVDQTYAGEKSTHFTMLQTAAYVGELPLVKLLCEHEADIYKTDDHGYSAIHWAAKAGHYDIVKFLLDQDKSLANAKGEYGRTPLIMAIHNLHYNVAELLLKNGADPNAQTTKEDHKLTALHIAVGKKLIDFVTLLLSHCLIDVDVIDAENITPLRLAFNLNQLIIFEEILKHPSCFKKILPDDELNAVRKLRIEAVMEKTNFYRLLVSQSEKKVQKAQKVEFERGQY